MLNCGDEADTAAVCTWSGDTCEMDASAYTTSACTEAMVTCMYDVSCSGGCVMDEAWGCVPVDVEICDLFECYEDYIYPESVLGLGCALQADQGSCESFILQPLDTTGWGVEECINEACTWVEDSLSCVMSTSAYDVDACTDGDLNCMWDATC